MFLRFFDNEVFGVVGSEEQEQVSEIDVLEEVLLRLLVISVTGVAYRVVILRTSRCRNFNFYFFLF